MTSTRHHSEWWDFDRYLPHDLQSSSWIQTKWCHKRQQAITRVSEVDILRSQCVPKDRTRYGSSQLEEAWQLSKRLVAASTLLCAMSSLFWTAFLRRSHRPAPEHFLVHSEEAAVCQVLHDVPTNSDLIWSVTPSVHLKSVRLKNENANTHHFVRQKRTLLYGTYVLQSEHVRLLQQGMPSALCCHHHNVSFVLL